MPQVDKSNLDIYTTLDKPTTRPRVVVLGSGWGAISFIKALPDNIAEKYDIVLVSPRNYFLYTPLLPAVATGTMEDRSIVEPVRNLMAGKVSGLRYPGELVVVPGSCALCWRRE